MNSTQTLSKYMFHELINKDTFKCIGFAVGFSVVIGSAIYVSSIGVMVILKSFNILLSTKLVNGVAMYVGSTIVYNTVKNFVNGKYS